MDIVTSKSKIIQEPRDIPNTPGLRIVGITKDAQFIWLTVQKGKDACCTLGEGVYATLESWMTVEDFKKFVLPAVEVAQ